MKQLLRHSGSYLILGLGDAVYVVDTCISSSSSSSSSNRRWTLLPPSSHETTTTTKNDPTLLQVQAVDLYQDTRSRCPSRLHCAVARRNKSLALYSFDPAANHDDTITAADTCTTTIISVQHYLVHTTEKRVTALCFTTIGDGTTATATKQEQQLSPPLLLVAADVVGDATAWSTTTSTAHRILAGHTASMITTALIAVQRTPPQLTTTLLYTADRDEKIRITSIFPQPNIIQGYLLGHTAYVTDIVVLKDERVVSIGGDGTIRYWKQQQLVDTLSIPTPSTNDDTTTTDDSVAVPVKLAALDSTTVAVVYDGDSTPPGVQLFHIVDDQRLHAGNVMPLSSPPLGIVTATSTTTTPAVIVYVLVREPPYLQVLTYNDGRASTTTTTTASPSLVDCHTAPPLSLISDGVAVSAQHIPIHVIERDPNSNTRLLEKKTDHRAVTHPSWNKVGRVAVNAERLKRKKANKRRRLREQQSSSQGEKDDPTAASEEATNDEIE